MKKRILSASIAAAIGGLGLVGAANAAIFSPGTPATGINVDDTGIGHNLVVPYFSTQNGNATLFSITNTDSANGKLLKVRFRGATNSDDLYDFQLLLSPGDVWSANVSRGADGFSQLTTGDTSCTIPFNLGGTNATFNRAAAGGALRINTLLTGDALANETREGYIEIINMADIPQPLLVGQVPVTNFPGAPAALEATNPLFYVTKHPTTNAAGARPVCASNTTGTAYLNALSADPVDYPAANVQGLAYPTGQLYANWTIINVPQTTVWSGEAVAFKAVGGTGTTPRHANAGGGNITSTGAANVVFFPQSAAALSNTTVNATAGAVGEAVTADPLLRPRAIVTGANQRTDGGTVETRRFLDAPDLSTPYIGNPTGQLIEALNQASVVSRALAATTVSNNFNTNPAAALNTDWSLTAPTRRYYVAYNYRFTPDNQITDGRVYTGNDYFAVAGPNAAHSYTAALVTGQTANGVAVYNAQYFRPANTAVSGHTICQGGAFSYYDTEEQRPPVPFVISPARGTALCGEVPVVSFNQGTAAATSALASNGPNRSDISLFYTVNPNTSLFDGWGTFTLTNSLSFTLAGAAQASNNNVGLPVVGKAYLKATNPAAAPGLAGTYGASFNHRYTRPAQ